MTKYAVILNRIVEADSKEDAIRKVKLTADYSRAECFEYSNEPHPFDGGVTCQDLVDIALKGK